MNRRYLATIYITLLFVGGLAITLWEVARGSFYVSWGAVFLAALTIGSTFLTLQTEGGDLHASDGFLAISYLNYGLPFLLPVGILMCVTEAIVHPGRRPILVNIGISVWSMAAAGSLLELVAPGLPPGLSFEMRQVVLGLIFMAATTFISSVLVAVLVVLKNRHHDIGAVLKELLLSPPGMHILLCGVVVVLLLPTWPPPSMLSYLYLLIFFLVFGYLFYYYAKDRESRALSQRVQHQNEQLTSVMNSVGTVSAMMSVDRTIDLLISEAQKAAGCQRILVLRCDESTGLYRVTQWVGASDELVTCFEQGVWVNLDPG